MLSESQIQRYARHILLPDVGGAGQEKLCAASIYVAGENSLAELAGDYLSAAGAHVDAHAGPGLLLRANGVSIVARADADEVRVIASRCPSCAGKPEGKLPLEAGFVATCLAASEALRIVLELGEASRAWTVRGGQVSRMEIPACTHEADA